MKIAVCQMKMEYTQEANLRKCLAAIETAAENGADMIVFPELTLMPFSRSTRSWTLKTVY